MRIAEKIIKYSLLVAISSVAVVSILVGTMSYYSAKQSLQQVTKDRFISLRNLKADQVQQYFVNLHTQAAVYASDLMVIDATKQFTTAFDAYALQANDSAKYRPMVIKHYLGEFAQKYARLNGGLDVNVKSLIDVLDTTSFDLQYYYILSNPYLLADKSKLAYADDGSAYSSVHKEFHDIFREYKDKLGLYDLLIADAESGRIIYSVMKELDFTTSLKNGPYANSGIGRAFQRANATTTAGYVVLEDFSKYIPSYNEQAAFIAAPIFSGDTKVGVMIFQLSTDALNNIMTSNGKWEEVGLGRTGESYIIGPDYLMRSMSRFFMEDPQAYLASMKLLHLDQQVIDSMAAQHTNIGLQPITTQVGKAVVAGQEGFTEYTDYRGIKALTAYAPLSIPDLNWGIIFGIDADEALAPAYALGEKIAWYSLFIMVVISIVAIVVARKLARQLSLPIERLCSSVGVIADSQDLTRRVDSGEIQEVADMAKAVNGLVSSFQRTCIDTVKSTQEMHLAADKLKQLAADINPFANLAQQERQNLQAGLNVHPDQQFGQQLGNDAELIKESGESLEELSTRLQNLSRQFKIFESEADRASGW